MAPPLTHVKDINCSLLLIYRLRRDERLSWPGWLTYSGRFNRISGRPSATGRAQEKESSPDEDRRSTAVPRNQPVQGQFGRFWRTEVTMDRIDQGPNWLIKGPIWLVVYLRYRTSNGWPRREQQPHTPIFIAFALSLAVSVLALASPDCWCYLG